MIRVRFHANPDDYRPVNWPVEHPYWCSGYGDDYSIVITYAPDEAYVYRNWPEATELDITEETEYRFSSRFPKPSWFTEPEKHTGV